MKLSPPVFSLLAGLSLCFANETVAAKTNQPPTILLISGENEYQSASTLPAFRKFLEARHGFNCFYLELDKTNRIRGLELLDKADLLVLFARRTTLPEEQLGRIKNYLDSGKPLIALRTSSHGFENWKEFDRDVLGGNYHNHHPDKIPAAVRANQDALTHPVLKNVPREFDAAGSLYKTSPVATNATVLLVGTISNAPPEPVAWTHSYRGGKIFYTSLGHPKDFENAAFRQLLVNAIHWSLDLPEPKEKLSGGLAGALAPGAKKKVGVDEFEKLWKEGGAIVLDVRTKKEFDAGHIPGAVNLDFLSQNFATNVSLLDKSAVYLVHCQAGVRSARACEQMSQMGFKYLADLAPGFSGWEKARKPVEK